jgi:hypothetical protein
MTGLQWLCFLLSSSGGHRLLSENVGMQTTDHRATSSAQYEFESSGALVESMLGRELIPGGEYALVSAARGWLTRNGCPREPHGRGRGRYLVPPELARKFRTECWPEIKHLARR